ncbi:T9SS type A sorting domain-containing protein [uncultured Prevotella sp.]|uniref:T9SS type A sorting domain-containing protein n=1 Tax=uncultured Prevotella sp. TaxID=159272 RepID=UPI0025DAEB74|nr:T9SS type A sorting domain-containing protein [uncultured Prevotella sp.]
MKRFTASIIGMALCMAAQAQPERPQLAGEQPTTDKTAPTTAMTDIVPAKATGTNYDVAVSFPTPLPTYLPLRLIDGMPIKTQVTNIGSNEVSGTVTLSFDGITVGTATFENLAQGKSETLTIELTTDINATTTKSTLTATAAITGQEDEDPGDNTASAQVTVTEYEFAYDHTTPAMYIDKNSVGADNLGSILIANTFHVSNPVALDSVSVAWGRIEGDKIGIFVWKWDAETAPDENGYYQLEKQIYFGTHNQGTGRGMHYYPLQETLNLDKGDYMVGISYYGYGIAVDKTMPNQMYTVVSLGENDYNAINWAEAGFGTAGIRMFVSNVSSGINTVTDGGDTSGASMNIDGSTLHVSCGESTITGVSVYSTSGATVYAGKANGHELTCDLSSLTPGVYMAKVTTAAGTSVRKFVVK